METKTFLDAGVTTSQTQAKITLTIKDGEPNIDFKTLSHCTTEALVNLLCNALLVTLNHAMQNSEKQIALQNLTNEQAEAAKDEAEEYFFDMANNCFSAVLNKFSPDIFNEPIPIEEARKLLEKEDAVLAKLVSAEEADGWQTK